MIYFTFLYALCDINYENVGHYVLSDIHFNVYFMWLKSPYVELTAGFQIIMVLKTFILSLTLILIKYNCKKNMCSVISSLVKSVFSKRVTRFLKYKKILSTLFLMHGTSISGDILNHILWYSSDSEVYLWLVNTKTLVYAQAIFAFHLVKCVSHLFCLGDPTQHCKHDLAAGHFSVCWVPFFYFYST